MIRIPAGNLFASASSIGGACKFFQVGRRQLREQGVSLLVVPLADIMVTIQAATQFRLIKNAWRNHAMHARASYDEAQARDIYGSVRGFLQQLARI